MYKALIADDEEIIRSGLSRLLARDPDFEVAALAEDGEQALELAAERLPDLLLVDINMPFLNGLEFIERLEGVLRGAVIIVITGYDDFSYAQQALRLGVFDYLLKPVMEDAFYDAVGRAKQQLQTNRRQVKYLDWARMQLEKNRSSLVAAFLDGWLEGRYSEPEVAEQLGYLGISIPEPYGVTVAHLSVNEGKTMVGQEWDENLLYYAAENIARELFEPLGPVTSCKNASGDLVVLSSCLPAARWSATARELRELLEEHLPAQAVLSQVPGDRLAGLPEAYDDAMELLEQREKCPQSVLEARRYIEERYADPCLSLQGAADRLHLSPPAPEPPLPPRDGGHLCRLPLAGAHPAGGRAARRRGAQDVRDRGAGGLFKPALFQQRLQKGARRLPDGVPEGRRRAVTEKEGTAI